LEGPNTNKEGYDQEYGMERRNGNFRLGIERKYDPKDPSSGKY
jgi:hypothetical protein